MADTILQVYNVALDMTDRNFRFSLRFRVCYIHGHVDVSQSTILQDEPTLEHKLQKELMKLFLERKTDSSSKS